MDNNMEMISARPPKIAYTYNTHVYSEDELIYKSQATANSHRHASQHICFAVSRHL